MTSATWKAAGQPADTPRLHALPPVRPWQRTMSRFRAHGLADPLARMVLASTLAIASSLGSFALFNVGFLPLAVVTTVVAAFSAAVYLSMAIQALRREKTIQYWRDRRDLRRRLERERGHRALLAITLDRVFELDSRSSISQVNIQVAFAHLVNDLFDTLSKSYGDLAVVLSHEADRRCRILHSAHSRGSRWRELKAGKQCAVEKSVEAKVEALADYHRTVKGHASIGSLRLTVLSNVELHERDEELIDQMPACLGLIAGRWGSPRPSEGEGKPFLVVGSAGQAKQR